MHCTTGGKEARFKRQGYATVLFSTTFGKWVKSKY